MWTHRTLPLATLLLGLAACGDKAEDSASEGSDGGTADGADGDGTDGGDGSEIPEGVVGSVVDSGGDTVALIDGRAFSDAGDGGALRVLLTSFAVGCAEAEDGLGFNTPAGGVWIGLDPSAFDRADLYEGDGRETERVATLTGAAEAAEADGRVVGSVTLDDDRGSATFDIEHCGSLDPFGP